MEIDVLDSKAPSCKVIVKGLLPLALDIVRSLARLGLKKVQEVYLPGNGLILAVPNQHNVSPGLQYPVHLMQRCLAGEPVKGLCTQSQVEHIYRGAR